MSNEYPYYVQFPPEYTNCLEEFLEADKDTPFGRDLYPDVFFTKGFFPLQRIREVEKMVKATRKIIPLPKIFGEIGSDKGGSLYHWMKCFPSITRVLGIEPRGFPYKEKFEKLFPSKDFGLFQGSSYSLEIIDKVKGWLGQDKIDILFIDGDKSAFDKDWDTYLPLMNPKGVVLFHDIQDDSEGGPMRKAWQRAMSQGYKGKEILDNSESKEALQRQKEGKPIPYNYESWLRFWEGKSCGVGLIDLSSKIV